MVRSDPSKTVFASAVLQSGTAQSISIRLCKLAKARGSPRLKPWLQVTPDDHSKVVPLLPIPNRTVKRLSADDSAHPRVKVGHRQAIIRKRPQAHAWGRFALQVTNDCVAWVLGAD